MGRLPDSGVYQVAWSLENRLRRRVGALGVCEFPRGCWVYTGSARRALRARVARHISSRKKRRWHIDYLLGPGRVIAVRAFGAGGIGECEAHARLARRFREWPKGFGSSDCRCATHIVYLGEKGLNIAGFLRILRPVGG